MFIVCLLKCIAEEPVENDVPPPKKTKAPAKSDQTNGAEAVEGRRLILQIETWLMKHSLFQVFFFPTETDRAVDPVAIEAKLPPPKIKQVKKTRVGVKTDHVEDIANLPPVSHPSHGNTPGQVDIT